MMASNVLRFDPPTSGGALRLQYTGTSTAEDVTQPLSLETGMTRSHSAGPSSVARIVPMMDLGGPQLRLRAPIYVTLEESDGFVVALSYDLELAEQGDTEFEALDGLRAAVLELFITVKELGVEAPPHLARKLAFLESLAL